MNSHEPVDEAKDRAGQTTRPSLMLLVAGAIRSNLSEFTIHRILWTRRKTQGGRLRTSWAHGPSDGSPDTLHPDDRILFPPKESPLQGNEASARYAFQAKTGLTGQHRPDGNSDERSRMGTSKYLSILRLPV